MREIGSIKQVQVQRSSLKAGQKPHQYYNPAPLLVVNSLLLTNKGVIGVTNEDRYIIDAHNVEHEYSRNQKDVHGISIGFTSHYETMRAKFGAHLVDGIAGENILVETEQAQELSNLEKGIAIRLAATGQLVNLKDVQVATPCLYFSRFAAEGETALSNEQLKETLQFLNDGRRGFYAALNDAESVAIQAGDIVFALD